MSQLSRHGLWHLPMVMTQAKAANERPIAEDLNLLLWFKKNDNGLLLR
jgi:hypothetical protein